VAKCSVCGAKNPDLAVSCANCGAPLYLQQPSTSTTGSPQPSETKGDAEEAAQTAQPQQADSSQAPVAVVNYKRGFPVAGVVSTALFALVVAVSSLTAGGLSYPLLAFLLVLVAVTVINAVGRNRVGLGRLRYEFYPTAMNVNYGGRVMSLPYSEVESASLHANRIVLEFKSGSHVRRIVVPDNPTVSGSTTLYEWLNSKIKREDSEGAEGGTQDVQPAP